MERSCLEDGCTRRYKSRGLCSTHWSQYVKEGRPLPKVWGRAERICTVEECRRKAHARGFCGMHYKQWKADHPDLLGTREKHWPRYLLPPNELVYLRRLVGLPDEGPTPELVQKWRDQEREVANELA